MQIQRIQSLYLFIAAILMTIFIFVPFGHFELVSADEGATAIESIKPVQEYGVLIPIALTAILLLIDIFLYNNLTLQKRVLSFCILFTLVTVAVVCFTVFRGLEGFDGSLSWWCVMVPVALILEILASRAITHDYKLLRSADRLR